MADSLPARGFAPFGGPSFHSRVGKALQKILGTPSTKPASNAWGYPIPGYQSPTATSVMAKDYFVSDDNWAGILGTGEYNYIVVGSGCTALAFIEETLRLNPRKRILCLERGDFWLPSHFQNLPLPFKMVLGGPSETFPWTLSGKTFKDPQLRYCHGSCPFFGGRSTFWSAWSPQPELDEMRKYPDQMIQATKDPVFWPEAKRLLNVSSAANIDDTIFAGLQTEIDKRLEMPLPHVPSATQSYPAQLSVGRRSPTSTLRFNKFSVPGPLLGIYENQKKRAHDDSGSLLDIMLNCVVEKLTADDDGVVRAVKTSRGTISWQGEDTKVVLCAGAFPAATILLNSFPSCARTVGKRVTGHFLTHIVARVPISDFGRWSPDLAKSHQFSRLEIAAHYLAGMHPKSNQQYHVQITAIHSPDPEQDAEDAARECPDYAAAATVDQLKDSTKHVVFVCAALGEFTEDNPDNWFKLDPNNSDITTNMKLQYTTTEQDRELWDLMDKATFETIDVMSTPPNSQPSKELEYWHSNKTGQAGFWAKDRPGMSDIRVPGIVHEASTAFVGDEAEGGSVDELGRPHGISNVCVTGGALFPTAGSWNPTLTMCGFTQHLARKLQPEVSLPVRQS